MGIKVWLSLPPIKRRRAEVTIEDTKKNWSFDIFLPRALNLSIHS
jgi:hypothetical protein